MAREMIIKEEEVEQEQQQQRDGPGNVERLEEDPRIEHLGNLRWVRMGVLGS
jgi:hypothetical protein